MKKKTVKIYNFLLRLRGPKAKQPNVLKLAQKYMDKETLGLFGEYIKSHLKTKKNPKLTAQQLKTASTLTFFMCLGYILRCMEEKDKKPAATTIKKMSRQRPPMA